MKPILLLLFISVCCFCAPGHVGNSASTNGIVHDAVVRKRDVIQEVPMNNNGDVYLVLSDNSTEPTLRSKRYFVAYGYRTPYGYGYGYRYRTPWWRRPWWGRK